MRHRVRTKTLDRKSGPRQALVRSMAISLINKEKVTTTPTKAKVVRAFVEKLITKGMAEDKVHAVRVIESKLANKDAAMKVVNELSPRFEKRNGGYTRLTKMPRRQGDGAEQVRLEFVS